MDAVTGPLLAEIDRFIEERGLSDSAFGLRAVNDHKFVPRLRRGSNVNSKTVTRVHEFITKERAAALTAITATYVVAGEVLLTGTVTQHLPDGGVVIQTKEGRLARLPPNSFRQGT